MEHILDSTERQDIESLVRQVLPCTLGCPTDALDHSSACPAEFLYDVTILIEAYAKRAVIGYARQDELDQQGKSDIVVPELESCLRGCILRD